VRFANLRPFPHTAALLHNLIEGVSFLLSLFNCIYVVDSDRFSSRNIFQNVKLLRSSMVKAKWIIHLSHASIELHISKFGCQFYTELAYEYFFTLHLGSIAVLVVVYQTMPFTINGLYDLL
jgi:hypothetical protein